MANIKDFKKNQNPVKVLQFGEGGFLRGFIDWMIKKMNDQNLFNGSVVVVQPIEHGLCEKLNEQSGLYTHIIRGSEGTETTVVDVIDRCINPFISYEDYLSQADNEELRFIVSNTTEAGIVFDENDKLDGTLPKTFPEKLTVLLKRRFENKLNGFIFLPCELIDRNGDKLKEAVLKCASLWNLGNDFCDWINKENSVSRILKNTALWGEDLSDLTEEVLNANPSLR